MKILVCIASYGIHNDGYLRQLIQEYRSMEYAVDLVILSNVAKHLDPGIEQIIGLSNPNPWSLPFGHKKLFAERAEDYDLFIYSEDDTLIMQRNIDAFLRATCVLPPNEIAGFLRTETGSDGRIYFSTVHSHYHWDPASVCVRGGQMFAHFSNDHSACFLMTQEQLKRAIASGGFLVEPYEAKYGLLETAATDPYTQCGFRKMVWVSRLEDFTLPHLPNKYVGRMGLEACEFRRQTKALQEIAHGHRPPATLLRVETNVRQQRWSKHYYEPRNGAPLSLLPSGARNVLSVGCGQGLTEQELVKHGMRVVALPLDSVISACAEAKGIEVILGDLQTARARLNGDRFDGILMLNVLHLLPDPVSALASFASLLTPQGRILVGAPNFSYLPYVRRRMFQDPQFKDLGSYQRSGLHATTQRIVRQWFDKCHLVLEEVVHMVPDRWQRLNRMTAGLADKFLGTEFIAAGRKDQ